jgi:cobalamin synthase
MVAPADSNNPALISSTNRLGINGTRQIMISKYRNRALWQIMMALILTGLVVLLMYRIRHSGYHRSDGWAAAGLFLYVGTYVMWMMASLSLARARGYNRDAMGALFIICYLVGFCIPPLPLMFHLFILFGLEDKAKNKQRRR